MCLRPATPGFVITLGATICLALVVFSVPWLKTIYFLEASLSAAGQTGNVTFGTLGYCLSLPGNTTCSSPKIGYQFDTSTLNELLNIDGSIPDLFVSWLTYPLFLHAIGLILAAIAAVFGLLAHIREFGMTCFSSCISGFAAGITMIAFIFDLVIFFLARSRLNSVSGGSALIGPAVWLTLASWLMLFVAGCAYSFGRCCLARRPRSTGHDWKPSVENGYSEAMRLEAVKAEADRRAAQRLESGLPAFQELERKPLSPKDDPKYLEEEEELQNVPYRDHSPGPRGKSGMAAGYSRPSNLGSPPPLPTVLPHSPTPQGGLAEGYGGTQNLASSPTRRSPLDRYGSTSPQQSYYNERSQRDYGQQYTSDYGAYQVPLPGSRAQDAYGAEPYNRTGQQRAYEPAYDGYDAPGEPQAAAHDEFEPHDYYATAEPQEEPNPNDYVDPYAQPLNAVRQGNDPTTTDRLRAPISAAANLSSLPRPTPGPIPPPAGYRSPYLPTPDYLDTQSPQPHAYGYEPPPVSPTRGARRPQQLAGAWQEQSSGYGSAPPPSYETNDRYR